MLSLLRILALTRKELLAILKDPRSRATLFMPPILQCLIYGYVATYDLTDVPYVVLDQDRSQASHELLARLDGSGVFHRVAYLNRADGLRTAINEQRAVVALQIGQDFERRLNLGLSSDVQVIADGRNSNTAATALGYVSAIVESFNADWQSAHGISIPPVSVVSRTWYNPNLETRWTMIPSLIGTLTLLQCLLLTAMSVAREREQGTFDQLLVTPFRPAEIMAGKALPSILVGLVQASVILLVAQILVSHSLRWVVRRSLPGTAGVPDGGGGDWLARLGNCSHNATGDALFLRHHDAVRALIRPDDSDQQHAPFAAGSHFGQSPALRHRHCAARVSGGGGAAGADAGYLATRSDRRFDAFDIVMGVPAPAHVAAFGQGLTAGRLSSESGTGFKTAVGGVVVTLEVSKLGMPHPSRKQSQPPPIPL